MTFLSKWIAPLASLFLPLPVFGERAGERVLSRPLRMKTLSRSTGRRGNLLGLAFVIWTACVDSRVSAMDAPPKVTVTERTSEVTLDNGIVSVDIDKQSGNIR